jgi:pimeloyl-ACP methyl ester carboxylesterase
MVSNEMCQGLSYHHSGGINPTVIFLPGYRSSMGGIKAMTLERHCKQTGRAFCRFDYRGHGSSEGDFLDLTLTDWYQDSLSMIQHVSPVEPAILVGSSMGAWIAFLVARTIPVHGIVAVAPAAELWLGDDVQLHDSAVVYRSSKYDTEKYPYTNQFISDAKQWSLFQRKSIQVHHAPVRLLHGMKDKDVRWTTSLRILEKLESDNVKLTLIPDGDHRLSTERDCSLIIDAVDSLLD